MKNSAAEQILLYLYNCYDAGLSYKAKKMLGVDDLFYSSNWNFKKEEIEKGYKNLKQSKFLQEKQQYDGSVIVSLSEKGRLRALNCAFRRFDDKKESWDGKWRMITFDIPNGCVKGRKALVYRLKSGGFYKLQESMFLYPYACEKEIRALANLFKIEKYIKLGLLEYVDGQERLIHHFKL